MNGDDDKQLSLADAVAQAEKSFSLPDGILRSLGDAESYGLNQYGADGKLVKSPTGATGAFQFTKGTAKLYGIDRNDPIQNVLGAAAYMQDNYKALSPLIHDNNEAWLAAAVAHNRGLGAVKKMIKDGRFQPAGQDSGNGGDTMAYATKIANSWADYRDKSGSQNPGTTQPQQPISPTAAQPFAPDFGTPEQKAAFDAQFPQQPERLGQMLQPVAAEGLQQLFGSIAQDQQQEPPPPGLIQKPPTTQTQLPDNADLKSFAQDLRKYNPQATDQDVLDAYNLMNKGRVASQNADIDTANQQIRAQRAQAQQQQGQSYNVYSPRQYQTNATDQLNTVYKTYDVNPKWSPEQKVKFALGATGLFTPQEINNWIADRKANGLSLVDTSPNSDHTKLTVTHDLIDAIRGPGTAKSMMRAETAQDRVTSQATDANVRVDQADLYKRLGYSRTSDITNWLNTESGKYISEVNPLFAFLPDEQRQEIEKQYSNLASSIAGGVIGGGGRTANFLGGVARVFADADQALGIPDMGAQGVYAAMSEIGNDSSAFEAQTGNGGVFSKIVKFGSGAVTGDLPRLMLLSALPGGEVVGFGLDAGFQALGRGETYGQAAKHAAFGAAMGGVFKVADVFGNRVFNSALNRLLPDSAEALKTAASAGMDATDVFGNVPNAAAKNAAKRLLTAALIGKGAKYATINVGTAGVTLAENATADEHDQQQSVWGNMALNSLFALIGDARQAGQLKNLAFKAFSVPSVDPAADPGAPSRRILLLPGDEGGKAKAYGPESKGPSGEPTSFKIVDITDKTTPEEVPVMLADRQAFQSRGLLNEMPAENRGNRGNVLPAGPEQRQLPEQTANRINEPDADAVAKLENHPRAQRIADILNGSTQPMSLEQLQKATRYKQENIIDAIETLYGARKIQINPDNTVQLISEVPTKVSTPLYDQFDETGRVSQPSAQQVPSNDVQAPETPPSQAPVAPPVTPEATPQLQPELPTNRGISSRPFAEPPAKSGLDPLTESLLRRDMFTHPQQDISALSTQLGKTPDEIRQMLPDLPRLSPEDFAKKYGVSPGAVKGLEPLGQIGPEGYTAHRMRAITLDPQNEGIFNELSNIFTNGSVKFREGDFTTRGAAADAVLDKIAQSVGKPRASQMDASDWGKVLSTEGDRMSLDTVKKLIEATDEGGEWGKLEQGFRNDPRLQKIVGDIINDLGVTTWEDFRDLDRQAYADKKGLTFEQTGGRAGVMTGGPTEQYRKAILEVAKDYAGQRAADGQPLFTPDAARRAYDREVYRRTGSPSQGRPSGGASPRVPAPGGPKPNVEPAGAGAASPAAGKPAKQPRVTPVTPLKRVGTPPPVATKPGETVPVETSPQSPRLPQGQYNHGRLDIEILDDDIRANGDLAPLWKGLSAAEKMAALSHVKLNASDDEIKKAIETIQEAKKISDEDTIHFSRPVEGEWEHPNFTPPYTTNALKKLEQFRGKEIKKQTIEQTLKQKDVKQIEKVIFETVLRNSPEFQEGHAVPFDQFEAKVRENLMPLRVIESTSYADYGQSRLGIKIEKARTWIFNTELEHGRTGHFSGDFKGTTEHLQRAYDERGNLALIQGPNAPEWELQSRVDPQTGIEHFFAVRRGVSLTQENLEANVGTYSDNREKVEEWIRSRYLNGGENKGLFGHARVWNIYDPTRGSVGAIAEGQSDALQKEDAKKLIADSYQNRYTEGTLPKSDPLYPVVKRIADALAEISGKGRFDRTLQERDEAQNKINGLRSGIADMDDMLGSIVPALIQATGNLHASDPELYAKIRSSRSESAEYTFIYSVGESVLGSKEISDSYLRSDVPYIMEWRVHYLARMVKYALTYQTPEGIAGQIEADKQGLEHLLGIAENNLEDANNILDSEEYKKYMESKEDLKAAGAELLQNIPLTDQQFIAHRKNYPQRLMREAIRRLALEGKEQVVIPTPLTLAIIEGYTSRPPSVRDTFIARLNRHINDVDLKNTSKIVDEDFRKEYGDMPYMPQNTDSDTLDVGNEIEMGGSDYTVVDSSSDSIVVALSDSIYTESYSDYREGEINSYHDNDLYTLRRLIDNKDMTAEQMADAVEGEGLSSYLDSEDFIRKLNQLDYDESAPEDDEEQQDINERILTVLRAKAADEAAKLGPNVKFENGIFTLNWMGEEYHGITAGGALESYAHSLVDKHLANYDDDPVLEGDADRMSDLMWERIADADWVGENFSEYISDQSSYYWTNDNGDSYHYVASGAHTETLDQPSVYRDRQQERIDERIDTVAEQIRDYAQQQTEDYRGETWYSYSITIGNEEYQSGANRSENRALDELARVLVEDNIDESLPYEAFIRGVGNQGIEAIQGVQLSQEQEKAASRELSLDWAKEYTDVRERNSDYRPEVTYTGSFFDQNFVGSSSEEVYNKVADFIDKYNLQSFGLPTKESLESGARPPLDLNNFSGVQKTILEKYIEQEKDFQKERPDARIWRDEKGNEWWMTDVTPEDKGDVVIFSRHKEESRAAYGAIRRAFDNNRASELPSKARAIFHPDTGHIEVNAEGAALIRLAISQMRGFDQGVFGGAYARPRPAQAVLNQLISMREEAKRKGDIARAAHLNRFVGAIQRAFDQEGDLTIGVKVPGAEDVYARDLQEELLHRADQRARDFQKVDLTSFNNLDSYRRAANTVKRSYPDFDEQGIFSEVIAKSLRSDALDQLHVTEEQRQEIEGAYIKYLIDQPQPTPISAFESFFGISNRTPQFIANAKQRINEQAAQRTSPAPELAPRREVQAPFGDQALPDVRQGTGNRAFAPTRQISSRDTDRLAQLQRTAALSADRSGTEPLSLVRPLTKEDEKSFFGDLDRYDAAQKEADRTGRPLQRGLKTVVMNEVTPLLAQLGIPDKPITVNYAEMRKAHAVKHDITKNKMSFIASAINDPVAVFDDPQGNPGSLAILTDLKDNMQKPIVAILRPAGARDAENVITTVFGIDRPTWLREVTGQLPIQAKGSLQGQKKDLSKFVNKEKGQSFAVPGSNNALGPTITLANPNILTEDKIVNPTPDARGPANVGSPRGIKVIKRQPAMAAVQQPEDEILFSRPAPDETDEAVAEKARFNAAQLASYIYDGKRDVRPAEAVVNLIRTGYLAGLSVVKTNLYGNTLNLLTEELSKTVAAGVDFGRRKYIKKKGPARLAKMTAAIDADIKAVNANTELDADAKKKAIDNLERARRIARAKYGPAAQLRSTPATNFRDALEGLFSATGAFREGLGTSNRGFVGALIRGVPPEESAKYDIENPTNSNFERNTGLVPLDAVMEGVKRVAIAIDRPFKAYARTAQSRGLARVSAKNLVDQGVERDWRTAMQKLIADPNQLITDLADNYAHIVTFQNPNAATDWVHEKLTQLRNPKFNPASTKHRSQQVIGDIATIAFGATVPFLRTPTNIGLRTVEYTPAGLISAAWQLHKIGDGYERQVATDKTRIDREREDTAIKQRRAAEDKALRDKGTKFREQRAAKLLELNSMIASINASKVYTDQYKAELIKRNKDSFKKWENKFKEARDKYTAERDVEFEKRQKARDAEDKARENVRKIEDDYADMRYTILENNRFVSAAGRFGFGMFVGGLILLGVVRGLIEAVGHVSFSDEDKDEQKRKEAMQKAGIPDFSVKIGNRRVPYDKFPFGAAAGMGVDVIEQFQRQGTTTQKVGASGDKLISDILNINPITDTRFNQTDRWSIAGGYAKSVTPFANMKILQEIGDTADPKARTAFNKGFVAQFGQQFPVPEWRAATVPESKNPLGQRGDLVQRIGRLFDPTRSVQEISPQSGLPVLDLTSGSSGRTGRSGRSGRRGR